MVWRKVAKVNTIKFPRKLKTRVSRLKGPPITWHNYCKKLTVRHIIMKFQKGRDKKEP